MPVEDLLLEMGGHLLEELAALDEDPLAHNLSYHHA
jgi:hypothetical protein